MDYLGEQFVIELKIWRGEKYHADGEEQLSDYLDSYHLKKGYMLTFSFNKQKVTKTEWMTYGDKMILETVV